MDQCIFVQLLLQTDKQIQLPGEATRSFLGITTVNIFLQTLHTLRILSQRQRQLDPSTQG